MASRQNPYPVFASAPKTYSQSYFDDMSRMLNLFLNILRVPGEGRQTTMTLTNLPTTDYGLENGALFQVDGVVRISIMTRPYVQGVSATGRVGTVTVTTV